MRHWGCWSRGWITPPFWIKENVSLGGIKRAGLAASLKARQACVRLSFLYLLLYCCCCFKKRNQQKRARNFQTKLIMNLLDQIFFWISEMWLFLPPRLCSASYCFFHKVQCVVSSEKERCFSIRFHLKELQKQFQSQSLSNEQSWPPHWPGCLGNALTSRKQSYQSTCNSQAGSRRCFDRKNVHRKLSVDVRNREAVCMVTSVSFLTRLLFQSHLLTVVLNQGAHQISWGAFGNVSSCALRTQRLPLSFWYTSLVKNILGGLKLRSP